MDVSHMLRCHHTLFPTDTLKSNTMAKNTTLEQLGHYRSERQRRRKAKYYNKMKTGEMKHNYHQK